MSVHLAREETPGRRAGARGFQKVASRDGHDRRRADLQLWIHQAAIWGSLRREWSLSLVRDLELALFWTLHLHDFGDRYLLMSDNPMRDIRLFEMCHLGVGQSNGQSANRIFKMRDLRGPDDRCRHRLLL